MSLHSRTIMNFTKPVVAGVDLTPTSTHVLAHAAQIAAAEGVPLEVVYVVFPGLLPHRPGCKPHPDTVDAAVRQAKQKLAQCVSQIGGAGEIRQQVLVGRPADEIHALVDRLNAGLLVISANHPNRKRLGTVASRCVRTVHCDVLLLRDREETLFRRVAACVDLSKTSEVVLARAIEETTGETELEILHVMYPPDRNTWGEVLGEEAKQEAIHQREEAEAAMARLVAGFADELKARKWKTTLLESTVPSVELTCHIADIAADLVVLGTRGHSKLGAVFLGTNAERLLHDAPVSVLAVRA
jgi:nucleotide-binding universal stress UspA family protein